MAVSLKRFLLLFFFVICALLHADSEYGTNVRYELLNTEDGSLCLEIAKGYLFSGGKKNLTVYDIKEPSL